MSIWDRMVAVGFRHLSDPARYTIAATGEVRDVAIIPIDEAETHQFRKGGVEGDTSRILARVHGDQMPAGWTGPGVDRNGNPVDTILHEGATYRVRKLRTERNDVYVIELIV
ncbi:hypothetical protein NZL82_01610 [Sphingomonas sanguinis]|uniref:hypothetical protein n=1 Tax=Sphingomonas sp. LC-1 TaxID=3110957 RepID=UPI0021BA7D19|nr:hypothetical protein [Sphingomonas sp. LC-1]MCT8000568.1 hypothetical protein [Sphingomonas sp. LC-1]